VSEEATQSDNTFYIRQGDSKDGYAEVTVAPDGTSVSASFYPPAPGGAFLTYPACAAKLDEQGIRVGLIHEMIQESILKAKSTHAPVKNVIIARATPPITEIPEHFVVRKDLIDRKPDIDPDAQRVDWHSISAFSIVKARDPIARRIAKVDGVSGQDVYGNEMSASVEKLPEFSAGTNVIEHETGLFAGKSGRLSIDPKGVISIEDVLVLKKGVDFTTGNVSFPGDIILQGKIADGFKVYSGGSIISSEVVDVTEIVCKKDMVVQAGIEGKKTGALRIGGTLPQVHTELPRRRAGRRAGVGKHRAVHGILHGDDQDGRHRQARRLRMHRRRGNPGTRHRQRARIEDARAVRNRLHRPAGTRHRERAIAANRRQARQGGGNLRRRAPPRHWKIH
jgi:uncharacterized protein (DUF342 family)